MKDESYWYREGWPHLLGQICQRFVAHGEVLFEAIREHEGIDRAVEALFEGVRTDIAGRIDSRNPGMWQYALPLLAEVADFKQRLLKDMDALRGEKTGLAPEQAFRRQLTDHLSHTLRHDDPHRAQVWRRLDKLSRELCHTSGDAAALQDRCSPRHFLEVRDAVLSKYPGDHNLPREYGTVESYFLEFCADCRHRHIDHQLLTADEVDTLSDELEVDLIPILHDCLAELEQSAALMHEIVAVKHKLPPVTHPNIGVFLETRGISRRRFETLLSQALRQLDDCLKTKRREGYTLWT